MKHMWCCVLVYNLSPPPPPPPPSCPRPLFSPMYTPSPPLFPLLCPPCQQVHVALDDQTPENGGMHFIPGSHKYMMMTSNSPFCFSVRYAGYIYKCYDALTRGIMMTDSHLLLHLLLLLLLLSLAKRYNDD